MFTIYVAIWTLSQLCLNDAYQELPDLPPEHLKRYLNTFPHLKAECDKVAKCRTLFETDNTNDTIIRNDKPLDLCWGFEENCDEVRRFQTPTCSKDHVASAHSKEDQLNIFYTQADFGYVRQFRDDLILICKPKYITDSSLECTRYLKFCRGRNLLFDFRGIAERQDRIRYHVDVLGPGEIQGHCNFDADLLGGEVDHMGALQSWSPELRNFITIEQSLFNNEEECDMIINTPTFLMKIDATYNMYHHFCDFFNLYATLFVNQSHPSAFDRDVQIIIWETYPYDSPFADSFKVFSRNPVWTLNQVKGHKVCFRNVVLPLLPRMIFGLYYNTPLIQGCEKSGLFRAFSEFILQRLEIPLYKPDNKIKITFLVRATKYRRVLNEMELIQEIESNSNYTIEVVSFERDLPFKQQLAITRNTDILIGMHGAGLTHLLFLPNWAVIFELYNCEDANCYKDLARLRGVHYITWENSNLVYPEDEGNHPQGGAHAKFTNYAFDPKEFARLVGKAATYVSSHDEYKAHLTSMMIPPKVMNNDEL